MKKTELCDEIARIIMADKETIKYGIETNDKALISLTIENLLENMNIMEISDIIECLEKNIKCEEMPTCKTDCDECPYYVTRPTMYEISKKILKLLRG